MMLEFHAGIGTEEDGIADFHSDGLYMPIIFELAGTHGDDAPLARLLLGRVGQKDFAMGKLGPSPLDEDTITERFDTGM